MAYTKSAEGRFVREMRDTVEEICNLFADALVDAGENYKATSQSQKNNTVNNGAKLQNRYNNYDKAITTEDISVLRSIGRKSINDFTSEDIQKSQKWAYKFYKELGTKSPFFRASFGDWRANDTGFVDVAIIPEYIASNEARKQNRGNVINTDTGWNIRISREGETNTISHAGEERLSEYGLAGIRQLIENSVLLDTEVHKHHSNNSKSEKTDTIAFDHKLYALGKSKNGSVGLYKITVEEAYQDTKHTNEKAFHNLKYIEKVATVGGRTAGQSLHDVSTNDNIATKHIISDLYSLVKRYDKDFSPGKEVNPALLNDDGTPKVLYHGTNSEAFYVFDSGKSGKKVKLNVLGNGYYFAENEYAAKNAKGEAYIVRFLINNYTNELSSVDLLYAINVKKSAVLKAPAITENPLRITDSNISIL